MNWTLLGGSLVAVLALAGIAAWLKLGGDPLDEDGALEAAGDMLPGFVPEAVLLGDDGEAALVRGREGRVAVVKRHGAQFAVRELLPGFDPGSAKADAIIVTGDRMFGDVMLKGRSPDQVRDFERQNVPTSR